MTTLLDRLRPAGPLLARIGAVAAFLLLVVAANWITAKYGPVTWDFGWASLQVTAGTYAAGLVLLCRDWVHDVLGRRWVAALIAAGAGASWWMTDSPRLAIASAVAFGISETVDLLIYQPLRRKSWARAATVSNLGGSVVDSFAFLLIAGFFAWPLLLGQVLCKMASTLIVVGGVKATADV